MEMRYGTKTKSEAEPRKKGKKAKVIQLHKKTKAKKTSLTYKDVIIMFLAEGLSLVEKNVEIGRVTVNAVRRAAKDLQASFPERAETLSAFAEKVRPVHTGRGRSQPVPGDERDYKAQKLGKNEPFLRLPLSVLDVKKGQLITVRFAADRLVVVKKSG